MEPHDTITLRQLQTAMQRRRRVRIVFERDSYELECHALVQAPGSGKLVLVAWEPSSPGDSGDGWRFFPVSGIRSLHVLDLPLGARHGKGFSAVELVRLLNDLE